MNNSDRRSLGIRPRTRASWFLLAPITISPPAWEAYWLLPIWHGTIVSDSFSAPGVHPSLYTIRGRFGLKAVNAVWPESESAQLKRKNNQKLHHSYLFEKHAYWYQPGSELRRRPFYRVRWNLYLLIWLIANAACQSQSCLFASRICWCQFANLSWLHRLSVVRTSIFVSKWQNRTWKIPCETRNNFVI